MYSNDSATIKRGQDMTMSLKAIGLMAFLSLAAGVVNGTTQVDPAVALKMLSAQNKQFE